MNIIQNIDGFPLIKLGTHDFSIRGINYCEVIYKNIKGLYNEIYSEKGWLILSVYFNPSGPLFLTENFGIKENFIIWDCDHGLRQTYRPYLDNCKKIY